MVFAQFSTVIRQSMKCCATPKVEIAGVKARVATKFFDRARGLIGRPKPPPGEGLLILKCNAIHTCFMSYPIDATFLDKKDKVVKVVRGIRPWKFFVWGGFKARKVLETALLMATLMFAPTLEAYVGVGDIYTRYDRDKEYSAKDFGHKLKLKGWKGERVHGLLVVGDKDGFKELSAKTSNDASRIDILRYTMGAGKWYADIVESPTASSYQGITRPFLYTFDIPRNTTKKTIEDKLCFSVNGKIYKLPVTIEVENKVLPPPSEWKFRLDIWQHPEAVARWHKVELWGDKHFELLSEYYQILADAGQKTITTSIISEPWNGQTYDKFSSMVGEDGDDFTVFDKVVETAERAGLKGAEIDCYSMIPWSLKFNPPSIEYEEYWGKRLKKLVAHLKDKGWLERTRIAMDERPDHLLKGAIEVLNKYAPELDFVMACDHPSKLNDMAKSVSYGYKYRKELLSVCEARRSQGKTTTFYVCCNPPKPNTFMASDLHECEALPMEAAELGFDGLLRWAFNSWPKDPFTSQDFGNWPSGDTSLVYPGPRLSMRWVLLREGIENAVKNYGIIQGK